VLYILGHETKVSFQFISNGPYHILPLLIMYKSALYGCDG
ncbi:uncharacterized protein METZ01_LOCUS392879, partial [marine metagenome]